MFRQSVASPPLRAAPAKPLAPEPVETKASAVPPAVEAKASVAAAAPATVETKAPEPIVATAETTAAPSVETKESQRAAPARASRPAGVAMRHRHRRQVDLSRPLREVMRLKRPQLRRLLLQCGAAYISSEAYEPCAEIAAVLMADVVYGLQQLLELAERKTVTREDVVWAVQARTGRAVYTFDDRMTDKWAPPSKPKTPRAPKAQAEAPADAQEPVVTASGPVVAPLGEMEE